MNELATRQCQEKTQKLDEASIQKLLTQLEGWDIEDGKLAKTFSFKGYYGTIAFVNLVAWIVQRQNHHPDLKVGYNKCRVEFTTHSVGGLSDNDFICAARIDAAPSA